MHNVIVNELNGEDVGAVVFTDSS